MDAMTAPAEESVLKTHEADFADFPEFFGATWPRLFRTAYAVAGDVSAAEDALQSAYAKAYASWRKIRSVDHPEAYVRRMAINEVLDVRRRAWWKAERSTADVPPFEPIASHESGILDHEVVWRAVLDLPVRQRAVVVLRYYEDLSEKEIAEALGCSPGTVKSQASRALANLRARGAGLADPGDPAQSGETP